MKVFVTGANGFLGSHLVDRLLARGDEVHILIRKTSNLQWLMGKPVHYHYGDVTGLGREQKGLKEALAGTDVVLHLAGIIRARNPQTYYEVNAQGTGNLLETCLKVAPSVKRVVVVTSLAAHGPNPDDEPATEDDECHPLTDYGKSKRDAELITLKYADKLPVSIVRPPAIYGPRDDQVLNFFKMVKWGIALLPGLGRHIIALAHVQDVAAGILLAAEHPKAVGEIFFIGDDHNYDWEELADLLAQAMGKPKPAKIPVPKALVLGTALLAEGWTKLTGRILSLNWAYAQNFLQANWGMDISKAKSMLGYRPSVPVLQGAGETAAWYREEEWL